MPNIVRLLVATRHSDINPDVTIVSLADANFHEVGGDSMRRIDLSALMICSLLGVSGCGIVPSFPDLWPFDDEFEPPAQPTPVTAQQGSNVAVIAPSQPQPSAEVAQLPPQPVQGGSGGLTPSAPGAAAYIISPVDGAAVTNPVRVLFGLDRMGIAPATLQHEATGHHHLLIDTELPPLDLPIPVDENHRHFSGGQTETTLNLPLGQHTLQLLLGDHAHTPHQPPVVSRKITITVQ
jgi:hypothetical protein